MYLKRFARVEKEPLIKGDNMFHIFNSHVGSSFSPTEVWIMIAMFLILIGAIVVLGIYGSDLDNDDNEEE